MAVLRHRDIKAQIERLKKKRICYIPKKMFERKGKSLDSKNTNRGSLMRRRRSRKNSIFRGGEGLDRFRGHSNSVPKQIDKKDCYKMVYQDILIPDEIYNRADFTKMKQKMIVKNMHHVVNDFYTK